MQLRSVHFGLTTLLCVATTATIDAAQSPQEDHSGKQEAVRPGWKLVWADEFDYTGLPDPTKWDYEEGYLRNNEAQYYTRARKENAWVEGGLLTITGRKEKFPIPPGRRGRGRAEADYTAASLTTRGKASWTFGRIEMRAKLPKGRGVWPAFWTVGAFGEWPRGGEIDIMEYVGKEPHDVHSNLHYAIRDQHTSSGGSVKLDNPWDEFHVYAVDWNSQRMEFSCDQIKCFTFNLSKADDKGTNPYRKPQYLILNLALGGGYGGPIDDGNLPQKFVIDYVRVYQPAVAKDLLQGPSP